MATLQQQLNEARLAKKGNPMKWVTISVVVIALGVAGYFGYPYLRDWLAKRSEAAKQASAPPPDTNAVPAELNLATNRSAYGPSADFAASRVVKSRDPASPVT